MNQKHSIPRRQFLQILALGGAAGLAWKLGLGLNEELETASETRLLMGTVVNLTVIGGRGVSASAVTACLNHMQELEAILSRFQSGSQLSQLNRTGELQQASPHLLTLLEQAHRISELSDGAFDITVKPLVDLYQTYQAARQGLPPDDLIRDRLHLVDYRAVLTHGEHVSLGAPGMAVTLDGIAKGYIVDQGVAVLRQHGLENVLVEAGGDLMACGRRDDDRPWTVGLQPPRQTVNGVMAKFSIHDQAAATSGDYIQTFTPDYSEYHILDPRTGVSPAGLASATVIAPGAAGADALATTLMVLGVEKGLALIRRLPGHEAYLISKDLQTYQTAGLE